MRIGTPHVKRPQKDPSIYFMNICDVAPGIRASNLPQYPPELRFERVNIPHNVYYLPLAAPYLV